jgi:hypothetical protein
MASEFRISPQGVYDAGIREDDDGKTYAVLRLPDNRTGDVVELTFMLPAFVAFADWVRMIADDLVDEVKRPSALK